ncbi:MAG: hypothetical protein HY727_14795 [Candidatus Rokubacteria bacterium]|nr:hypothetical protein [Candidatus Rokubacteria bacterium]
MALSHEDIQQIKTHLGYVYYDLYSRYLALLHLMHDRGEGIAEELERKVDAWIAENRTALIYEIRNRTNRFYATGPWRGDDLTGLEPTVPTV